MDGGRFTQYGPQNSAFGMQQAGNLGSHGCMGSVYLHFVHRFTVKLSNSNAFRQLACGNRTHLQFTLDASDLRFGLAKNYRTTATSTTSWVTRADQLKQNFFGFTDLLSSQTPFTHIEVVVRYADAFCEVTNLADYFDSTMSLLEPLLHLGNVAHASIKLSSDSQWAHRDRWIGPRSCQSCSALRRRFELIMGPLFQEMKEMVEAHWTGMI